MIAVMMMMTIHSQGEEDTAEPGDEVSNEVAAWNKNGSWKRGRNQSFVPSY